MKTVRKQANAGKWGGEICIQNTKREILDNRTVRVDRPSFFTHDPLAICAPSVACLSWCQGLCTHGHMYTSHMNALHVHAHSWCGILNVMYVWGHAFLTGENTAFLSTLGRTFGNQVLILCTWYLTSLSSSMLWLVKSCYHRGSEDIHIRQLSASVMPTLLLIS